MDEINQEFHHVLLEIKNEMDNFKNDKNSKYIQQINEYIESNYMFDTLSSAEIADKLGLAQSYVNRNYRKHACMSITNYIKQVRLEKAAQLMRESDYSIEKILERVGWTTKEYFYSTFKKAYGLTPGEFRAKS